VRAQEFLQENAQGREVIWAPQEGSQKVFLSASKVYEVLYASGRGVGKTDALLISYAMHVGKGYGSFWTGIIFRRVSKDLDDIKAKSHRLFRQMFPDATYNSTKSFWEFKGGERLYFTHMDTENDYWGHHGKEYPFIGWEELTTWPSSDCYKLMMSCCRSTCPDPSMPRMIRATTNPSGVGHGWVKQRFRLPGNFFQLWQETELDPVSGKEVDSEPRLAINGYLAENKALLRAQPNYLQQLVSSAPSQHVLRAWVYGDWNIVAGGMFDDVWDATRHVVPAFEIPASWRIDRAFDWGGTKPFSLGWYAESDGNAYTCPKTGRTFGEVPGDTFRIAEWYGTTGKPNEGLGLSASEFAKRAKEYEVEYGIHSRCQPGPADVNIFSRDRGPTIHSEYQKFGIRFSKADKGPFSRQKGWEVVRNRLRQALPREDGQPRELPGLFIFSRCVHFQNLVPSLPRSTRDPDDIDTDSEDHIADELRYRMRRVKRELVRTTF